MAKALVVGIGHPFRRDDGLGPLLAERIGALALPGLQVLVHHGEGSDLMERWQGFARVVLIDATRSDSAPGTVRHWDHPSLPPAGVFAKTSHLFGVAEALEMAALLGRQPPAWRVVGVEGADFSAGCGLTDQVEDALDQACRLVVAFLSDPELI